MIPGHDRKMLQNDEPIQILSQNIETEFLIFLALRLVPEQYFTSANLYGVITSVWKIETAMLYNGAVFDFDFRQHPVGLLYIRLQFARKCEVNKCFFCVLVSWPCIDDRLEAAQLLLLWNRFVCHRQANNVYYIIFPNSNTDHACTVYTAWFGAPCIRWHIMSSRWTWVLVSIRISNAHCGRGPILTGSHKQTLTVHWFFSEPPLASTFLHYAYIYSIEEGARELGVFLGDHPCKY